MGGRVTHTNTVGQRVAGMSIQTSLLGQPIPIGWGRGRLSCNLIDYVAFTPIPHTTTTTTSSSSGGKAGTPSTTTSDTTYTYTASIELGLCEGPITGINAVWKDSSYFSGSGALASAGLSVALGTSSQLPWSYMTSLYPDHALAYRTLAYLYAQDYDLGSNGVVANHSFEVDFAIRFNPSGGIYDALPKDILTDFLTNADHGVPSWPSSVNGDWSDWGTYCQAAGIFLSPVLDQTVTASEFVRRLMDESNSDCFFSEGVLKIKSHGDDQIAGNGATWTPDLTPIYNITEDDLAEGTEVQLEIIDLTSTYNYVQIEYLDRTNQYQTAVAIAHDLNDIVTYARRMQTPQQFHDICDPQIARNVAQLWLQRQLFTRDNYHFKLPADFDLLEPMDYISLSTTVDGMQLNGQLVRIISIDEDADGKDTLTIVAEGIPGHTNTHALYAAHSPYGVSVNVNVAPGSISTPFLFNAPQALTANGYEVWAAVASTNVNWGGAVVHASFDGTNYTPIGSINGPARYGVLSASLPSHADPDSTDTLSVDLTTSLGKLATVTQAEADAGATLCWVDGELICFETATLTATNKYNLTYLRRGQQGSAISSHASGTHFARLDAAIFKYAYLPQNAGKTVYLKFQSYNVYGRALQDISTCTAYTITLSPTGSTPVGNPSGLGLAAGGSTWTGNAINLICNSVPGATSYQFNIYKSDGTTLIRTITSATPQCTYTSNQANIDGAQRSYKVSVTPYSTAGAGTTSGQISISNAAPGAVSGASAAGGAYDGTVSCTASTDPDLAGYVVFYSATSGFNPSTDGSMAVSGGPSVDIGGLAAGTYYCRIAAYDPWTSNPALLNLSAEMSFAISTGTAGGSTGGGSGTGGWSNDTGGRLHYY